MPMDPQMGAAAMAGGGAPAPTAGGGMPPPPPPQGGQPPMQPPQTPDGGTGTDVNEIVSALKQALPQCIDDKGYVDMNKLITMWPQISKVPFQTVMQLIQQNPEILNDLITQYGLAGIIVQGKTISADELASMGQKGGGQ